VARQLQRSGIDAVALAGGFDAWRAAHPVEPKVTGAALAG